MIDYPSTPDWCWFGGKSLKELADCGTDEDASWWIQNAWCWLYGRLPDSQRKAFSLPLSNVSAGPSPSDGIPFPAVYQQAEKGVLLFLKVDTKDKQQTGRESQNDSLRYAHQAASYVFDLFRKMNSETGYPELTIEQEDLEGSSLSLAAMIGALAPILHVDIPDDIISTGCYVNDNKPTLKNVAPHTLTAKVEVAAQFGYKRFLVVEGQKGPHNISPNDLFDKLKSSGRIANDAEMAFIEVSSDPLAAIFQILKEIPEGTSEAVVSLLVEFDRQYLKCAEDDFINECLSPFLDSSSRIVRHVAADILRRCLLHKGKTAEAEEYRKKMPALNPADFPVDRLGTYLKYEEIASLYILELDRGDWDENRKTHRLTERILDRIQGNAEDNIADIEEIRAAKNIANTRARYYLYRGRMEEDASLVEKGWQEIMRFQTYWDSIFEYASSKNISDEPFSRQRNQCIDILYEYLRLTGNALNCPVELWPKNEQQPDENAFENIDSSFDLTAWFRWQIIQRRTLTPEMLEPYLVSANEWYNKKYPGFLPYELPLIHNVGTPKQQEWCRTQLRATAHLRPEKQDGTSDAIMLLLAMRTAFLLNDPEFPPEQYRRFIAPDSPLCHWADQLLSAPEKIVFRCPY